MMKLLAVTALALTGWSLAQPLQAAPTAQPLDALVIRLADPSLDRVTPDGLDAALAGAVRFDEAPSAMTAPFCAITLPVRQGVDVADGIANFTSDATGSTCPTPHLRHLALRVATPTPGHVVDVLQRQLGTPTETIDAADGMRRVSWTVQQHIIVVEYDMTLPESSAISVVRRTES